MKNPVKNILSLALRYGILIILGLFGIGIFYSVFSLPTIYAVFYLLKPFFVVSLSSDIIMINENLIEIIGPCVAGSAYYLLMILNLAIPKIKIGKRIALLLFSFSSLLLLNILRIFLLSVLFVSGFSFFDFAHKMFWYAGSTIFVAGIWFLGIKLFNIKGIPFYSDIKSLLKLRKNTKKSHSRKRH